MSGWVLEKDDEANLIKKIVQEVLKQLDRATMRLDVAKYPVGIEQQISMLQSHPMSTRTTMIGLYGIGGIGKTTLAKALYNRIAHNFEGCCFLSNIREASNQYGGLVQLQEKLLSEILMDDLVRVSNQHRGINIIRDRLCSKKILLVLDDVDTSEQLQALVGGHDWFGVGSKIIATTRNKHLLAIHGFDILHSVPGLNYYEALELFSWHAFKISHPSSDYLDLSKRAVRYCNDLPLALEVLGSFLYCTEQSKFERILDEYENSNLDKDIQDILRISYDGLEDDIKDIFLFISCFFKREDITMAKTMLEECGCLCLEKGIQQLTNLSLLTINNWNKVEMHDLIQQMGRTIVRSDTSKSHKRKKLLMKDDALDVLSGNKEARAVKAIKLDFPKPTELDIDSRAFEKVKNLVVLKVHNATSSKTLDFLPSSLRLLVWSGFPFSSLPSTYSMENLIQLKLPYSSIKHFGRGFMSCERLKQLDLSYSDLLEEVPDLSAAINLEKLNLYSCRNLVKIHESVGSLGKLVHLRLSSSLDGFKQFPSPLKLKSLKTFGIENGRVVDRYPQFSEEMKSSVEDLRVEGSIVTELSPTIGYLTSLKYLTIFGCSKLTTLPSTIYLLSNLTALTVSESDLSTFPSLYSSSPSLFPYLTNLDIIECKMTNLDFLETIASAAPSLRDLNLSGNNFSRLPSCIVNFKSLRFLYIANCKLLEEIQKIPEGIIFMDAGGCISMAKFPDNLAAFITCDSEHVYGEFKQLILMNCDIPEWYSYKSMNNPITFFMPFNHPSGEFKVFAPCIKFQLSCDYRWIPPCPLECKVSINDIEVWSSEGVPRFPGSKRIYVGASPNEYMWLIVLYPDTDFHPHWRDIMKRSPAIDLRQPSIGITSFGMDNNNNVKFMVSFGFNTSKGDVSIKKCGVHLIMEE